MITTRTTISILRVAINWSKHLDYNGRARDDARRLEALHVEVRQSTEQHLRKVEGCLKARSIAR